MCCWALQPTEAHVQGWEGSCGHQPCQERLHPGAASWMACLNRRMIATAAAIAAVAAAAIRRPRARFFNCLRREQQSAPAWRAHGVHAARCAAAGHYPRLKRPPPPEGGTTAGRAAVLPAPLPPPQHGRGYALPCSRPSPHSDGVCLDLCRKAAGRERLCCGGAAPSSVGQATTVVAQHLVQRSPPSLGSEAGLGVCEGCKCTQRGEFSMRKPHACESRRTLPSSSSQYMRGCFGRARHKPREAHVSL